MQTVRSHNIELKEVTEPLNELDVRAQGFKGFLHLKFTCFLKTFITKMVHLVFHGTEESDTIKHELKLYCNIHNNLYISIQEEKLFQIMIPVVVTS